MSLCYLENRIFFKYKEHSEVGGGPQLVERLPSLHKAVGLITQIAEIVDIVLHTCNPRCTHVIQDVHM